MHHIDCFSVETLGKDDSVVIIWNADNGELLFRVPKEVEKYQPTLENYALFDPGYYFWRYVDSYQRNYHYRRMWKEYRYTKENIFKP